MEISDNTDATRPNSQVPDHKDTDGDPGDPSSVFDFTQNKRLSQKKSYIQPDNNSGGNSRNPLLALNNASRSWQLQNLEQLISNQPQEL